MIRLHYGPSPGDCRAWNLKRGLSASRKQKPRPKPGFPSISCSSIQRRLQGVRHSAGIQAAFAPLPLQTHVMLAALDATKVGVNVKSTSPPVLWVDALITPVAGVIVIASQYLVGAPT
jgi:hypothetical protein